MKKINENPAIKNAFTFFAFSLTLLISSNLKAVNYYWVGGTGSWTDFANHWATTSGGSTFHTVLPGTMDDVYFDINSFTSSGQVVTFDASLAFCKDFNWINTIPGARALASTPGDTLIIKGSVFIDSTADFDFNGKMSLGASFNSCTISIADTLFADLELYNNSGVWNLTNGIISRNEIKLVTGFFYTDGYPIICKSLKVETIAPGLIDLGTSTIYFTEFDDQNQGGYYGWSVDSFANVLADSATFVYQTLPVADVGYSPGQYLFSSHSTSKYKKIIFNGNTSGALFPTNQVFTVAGSPQVNISFIESNNVNVVIHDVPKLNVDTITSTSLTTKDFSFNNNDTIAIDYLSSNQNVFLNAGVAAFSNININNIGAKNLDMSGATGFVNPPALGNVTVTDSCSLSNVVANNIIMQGNGTIVNTNADSIKLTAGKDYIFSGVTINASFDAIGNSANFIQLHSPQAGIAAGVLFNQPIVCGDYLNIKDISVPGANFYAGSNSVDLGGNSGIAFTSCPPPANAYYWVGGTGEWNDFANHWATSSGGTTFHISQPGPTDDVYFDGNSFLSNNDTVYVNPGLTNIYNRDFRWQNLQFTPTFYVQSNTTLNIYGSFFLHHNMNFAFLGKIKFTGINSNNQIDCDGVPISGPIGGAFLDQVTFSSKATWNFLSPFIANSAFFYKGNLNTNNNDLTFYEWLYIYPQDTLIINYGSSTVLIGDHMQVAYDGSTSHPLNMNVSNSTLVFDNSILPGTSGSVFYIDSMHTYNNVIFRGPGGLGWGVGPGGAKIKKLTTLNDFNTIPTLHIDTLFLNNPGHTFSFPYMKLSSELIANGNASFPITLNGNASGTLIKPSGTLCLHDVYLQNINASGGAQFFAGNGCVDLGGNSGWQFAPCNNISNVWPGDANYDLKVTNFDILNLGLAYNETGPLRAGASLAYVAQPATDWNGYFQTAVNKKHADTNGDGVVDDNDTTAISINYGLTHPARMGAVQVNALPTDPYLYLNVNPDSVNLSDTVYIETFYGTSQTPVDSVYGIAFTINYDTTLVDTSWISTEFLNSWFGQPGSDLLTFSKSIPLEQKIDMAIVRTDHNNVSGFGGPICRTGIVIVDNVAGRMPLPFTISDPYALTASEYELGVNLGNDTVLVDTTALGIGHIKMEHFTIAPNPAKDLVVIKNIPAQSFITIYNVQGEIVFNTQATGASIVIDTRLYSKGIYTIRVNDNNKMAVGKLIKL